MKYTTDEAIREIMLRRKRIEIKRERHKANVLMGLSVSLIIALTMVIGIGPGRAIRAPEGMTYGAFLLSPEAGGYILIAILAFAVGIMTTLICLQLKKKSDLNLGGMRDEGQAEENEDHGSDHGDRHVTELPVGVLVPEGIEGSDQSGNDDRRRDGK